jgi:GntR family transcriptional regulator/MocR family aminotransferase
MYIDDLIAAAPLDRAATTPLFRQLYARLKEAILHGRLAPGTRLPPTRDLAQQLGVSRQTVLAAYDQLTAEGYLRGGVGQGTFVDAGLPAAGLRAASAASETATGPATGAAITRSEAPRPLPARGAAIAASMARVRHHHGPLRAFRPSMPGLDLFPFDVWRKLEARQWRRRELPLGYGAAAGHPPLRELLCAYLNASRGVRCTPEQIIVTTGSQQALYLLAQLLLAPGEGVWLESPGYQGAAAPFEVAGARMCLVPVDADGMDVAHAAARYPDAAMVFATPSHQLPLGVTMSLGRRLELLRWAEANRAWIIEDDYDSEYRYTGPPLASLQSLDRAGCVIYVGTLSKVLFPGLRLGYVVAPPALVEPLTQAKAVVDRHSPIVPQAVLADFIQQGHFTRHIRRTRDAYAERRAAMLEALDARLGGMLAPGPTDTGLDVCVRLTGRLGEAQAAERAAAAGIDLRPLSYYIHPHAGPECAAPPGLLLGFSAFTPADIRTGVGRLAQALAP